MNENNEPKTIGVLWLSNCQIFDLFRQAYTVAIIKFFASLSNDDEDLLDKLSKKLSKWETLNSKDTNDLKKMKDRHEKIKLLGEKLLKSSEEISTNPEVGAIAVEYPDENAFSVFIGIALNKDEKSDIDYIKRMGQRQPAWVGRALFPQFNEMAYHS